MYNIKVPINEEIITPKTLKNGKIRKMRRVVTTGYNVKGPFTTYDEAWTWILKNQPSSVDTALKHQGYKITES